MTDPLFTHKLEQLGAMMRDLAVELAVYYSTLVECGVPPYVAASLTGEMQNRITGEWER